MRNNFQYTAFQGKEMSRQSFLGDEPWDEIRFELPAEE
jgi:hypothetical protein